MFENDKPNLLALLDSCEKILDYTKNTNNVDDFAGNAVVFDAVMMNFIVIGETVSKLSKDLKEEYDFVEWIRITDFRNIVAHDYFGIDAEEVWQIINDDIPVFISNLNLILKDFSSS